ncbi:MAG: SPOR domain-containing protein [Magnetococcales bacterium]|nr:SPOR domain-containing protein [Magnetococcales bacterium]
MDTGTKIDAGRYTVRRPFGKWALGSVYLAEETGTGRMLVLRALPDLFSAADTAFFEKFEKVVADIAKLSVHPGVSPSLGHLYDAGQKRRFLLSSYEDGVTLGTLRAGRSGGVLPPSEALELVKKIAVVLNHAHLEGVCHRNLNPGNVIIMASGEVRLVNFGLAYALRALAWSRGVDFDQKILQEQVPYASPEQYVVKSAGMGQARNTLLFAEHGGARFLGQTPDSGGDIYALAVMFYEMVSGQLPFSDEDRRALSAARWRGEGPVPKPLAMLSDEQNMILERALHWDPRQRLASAMAFIHAMTPSIEGSASAPSAPTRIAVPKAQDEADQPTEAGIPVSAEGVDQESKQKSDALSEEDALPESGHGSGEDQERRTSSGKATSLAREAAWYQTPESPDDMEIRADIQKQAAAEAVMETRQGTTLWPWILLAMAIVLGVGGVAWWAMDEGDSGAGVVEFAETTVAGEDQSASESAIRDLSTPGDATEAEGYRTGQSMARDIDAENKVTAESRVPPGEPRMPPNDQKVALRLPTGEQKGEARLPSGEQKGEARLPSGEQKGEARLPSGEQKGEARLPLGEQKGEARLPSGEQKGELRLPSVDQAADLEREKRRAGAMEQQVTTLRLQLDEHAGALEREKRRASALERQVQTLQQQLTDQERRSVTPAMESATGSAIVGAENSAGEEQLRAMNSLRQRLAETEERLQRAQSAEKRVAELEARLRQVQTAAEKVVEPGRSGGHGQGGFIVQLTSHSEQAEADALVRQVNQIRFRDRPLPVFGRRVKMGETTWFRVGVGPFASRQEAEQVVTLMQERIKATGFVVPAE